MAAPIFYVGPIGPVDVPLARAVNVAYGDAIEVVDPEVRAGLLRQEGNWSETDPNAKPDKSKAAPAVAPDAPKE